MHRPSSQTRKKELTSNKSKLMTPYSAFGTFSGWLGLEKDEDVVSIPLLSPRRLPTAETIWIEVAAARISREKAFIVAIQFALMNRIDIDTTPYYYEEALKSEKVDECGMGIHFWRRESHNLKSHDNLYVGISNRPPQIRRKDPLRVLVLENLSLAYF